MADQAAARRALERALVTHLTARWSDIEATASMGSQIDIEGTKEAGRDELIEVLMGDVKRAMVNRGFQTRIGLSQDYEGVITALFTLDNHRVSVVCP